MSRNRALYHPDHAAYAAGYRDALTFARADLNENLAALHGEVDELRGIFHDVVTMLRSQAEADVSALRAQLEFALIRLTRRDPATPLH
jgi:hypothetical protein